MSTTTQQEPPKEAPKLREDGVWVICAWCWPGRSALEAFPHLQSAEHISNGMCVRHKDLMMAEHLASVLK